MSEKNKQNLCQKLVYKIMPYLSINTTSDLKVNLTIAMDDSDQKELSPDNLWNSLVSDEGKPSKKDKQTNLGLLGNLVNNSIIPNEEFQSNEQKQDWFYLHQPLNLCCYEDGMSSSSNFLDFNHQNIQMGEVPEKLEKRSKINKHQAIHQGQQDNIDLVLDKILNKQSPSNHIKHIFKEERIKFRKKNTNVPKFIIRVFFKYFHQFNTIKHHRYSKIYQKAKQLLGNRKTNNYNISDILTIFKYSQEIDPKVGINTREVLAAILRNVKKEQLICNPYIDSNIHSYMVAVQIYSIRCRSKVLSERVKVF